MERTGIIRTQTSTHVPWAPPHVLNLGVSRILTVVLLLGHLVTLLGLCWARPEWAPWTLALLLPVFAASLYRGLMHHALRRAPGAVRRVELRRDGRVILQCRDGSRHGARVLDSSTVHPWAIVLNLRHANGVKRPTWPRNVIALRDACDPGEFRRLRVWLRWGHRGGPDHDGGAEP